MARLPTGYREESETAAPDLGELSEVDPSFVARYGRVITRRGVAAVPRAIFTHQSALSLTPQQVWFITYIFSFQWDTALPYPSIRHMAALTGYSRVQLHNIKSELVNMSYLRLVHRANESGGQDTNAYDFSGLLDAIRAQLKPDPRPVEGEDEQPASEEKASPSRLLPGRRGRRTPVIPERTQLPGEGSTQLSARDRIQLHRGNGKEFSEGDSVQFAGGGRNKLPAGGRGYLPGEDSAELSPPDSNRLATPGNARKGRESHPLITRG